MSSQLSELQGDLRSRWACVRVYYIMTNPVAVKESQMLFLSKEL